MAIHYENTDMTDRMLRRVEPPPGVPKLQWMREVTGRDDLRFDELEAIVRAMLVAGQVPGQPAGGAGAHEPNAPSYGDEAPQFHGDGEMGGVLPDDTGPRQSVGTPGAQRYGRRRK